MTRPELTGRMTKWAIQLGAYDVRFEPRTAIKSQALADFVADFSPNLQEQARQEITLDGDQDLGTWRIQVDGMTKAKTSGLGVMLESPQGDRIHFTIKCEFPTTNNEAEYEGLIFGLTMTRDMQVRKAKVESDSTLVINQVNGTYAMKEPRMEKYLEIVKQLVSKFEAAEIKQVPREENQEVDALANLGTSLTTEGDASIPVVHLMKALTGEEEEGVRQVSQAAPKLDVHSWTTTHYEWLKHDVIPATMNERRFRMKVSMFVLVEGCLYQRSVAGPYLRCLDGTEVTYVLRQAHKGDCRNHSGGCALTGKVLRMGYWWLTLKEDAVRFASEC